MERLSGVDWRLKKLHFELDRLGALIFGYGSLGRLKDGSCTSLTGVDLVFSFNNSTLRRLVISIGLLMFEFWNKAFYD